MTALPGEASCFAGRRVSAGDRLSLPRGLTLQLSGLGRQRARRAALALVDSGAGALLSFGTAAGLDPTLAPGIALLPSSVVSESGKALYVDRPWHQRCVERLKRSMAVETRPLAEARAVLYSAQLKARLFAVTQAVAADMESAAVAEVAMEFKKPVLVVRALADPAGLMLPPSALAAVDEEGRLRPFRLLASVLRNPGDVAGIMRLRRGFNAARRVLTEVTRVLGPTLTVPDGN